jgi:asparagine synthase (glutamine-hydrolysing)
MPGIAGIIGANGVANKPALDDMVKAMMHERFYVSGANVFDPVNLAVGWVGIKGAFASSAPIWNRNRDICLILSGEHFGNPAQTNGANGADRQHPAEEAAGLVELYESSGRRFFEILNGWFSGVLVDLRESKVILFNDRYGLNRVYYHESVDGFHFASEAKCLLKILPQLRQLDSRSLGEFLSCGCVLQNRSLFSGISLLPGGSIWSFYPDGRVSKETYFRRESWENQPQLSHSEYYEKLKETFSRILPRYFGGNERVAVSLTGGLDSRMIMAWAPPGPFKLPCYTFGGMYRECADVRIARRIAKLAQQHHEVIPVHRKFFSEFPALAKRSVYFTDGAMDVTGAVELFVNRQAREIAPVRLTGNYGDEILRGNVAFRPSPVNELLLNRDFVPFVRQAAATYAGERQGSRPSFIAFKQTPWHHFARFALERTQVMPRSPYLDNDLVSLSYQVPAELASSCDPALRLIHDGDPELTRIPTDRGHLYDAMFLTGKVRECCQKLTAKAEYAYDYGMPEWLVKADRVFAPLHLEKHFLGRHKFYHFRTWYRNELSQYVRDILLDARTRSRPCFQGEWLEEMVSSHIQGRRNHTVEITQALTVELIHRQFIDQKCSA